VTLTLVTVSGQVTLPDGSTPTSGKIIFKLARWDSEGSAVVIPDKVQAAITGGNVSVEVWASAEGENDVYYQIIAQYYSTEFRRIVDVVLAQSVSVPALSPVNLSSLIEQIYIPEVRQSVIGVVRADRILAQDAATRAEAVVPFANVAEVISDTGFSYSTVTTGQILRTADEGFAYEVAASGASDHDITTAGGVKLYVQPVAGQLPLLAFGSPGDGTSDFSAAVQKALNAAATRGIMEIVAPAGRYGIGTAIAWPQLASVRIVGVGYKLLPIIGTLTEKRGGTWFRRIADVAIFDMTGVSSLSGGPLTHRPNLYGLLLDGAGLTEPLIKAHSCTELVVDNCGFIGVDGVGIDALELFDSRFTNCRFTEMGKADGTACIALRSGFDSRESSNQIHFTGCVWESFPGSAISARKFDSGSIDVNEIYFTNCKMETATGATPILDLQDVSGIHFGLLQLALAGDVSDTIASLVSFTDSSDISGTLHVELFRSTGATVTNHVVLTNCANVALQVFDYGERDVASGISCSSSVVNPSIQYDYVGLLKTTVGTSFSPFINSRGRGRLQGKSASPALLLDRSDIADELWDLAAISADGAGSRWEITHNGTPVLRINDDNTITNLFAMVLGASVNVNNNRLANISAMSRNAWAIITSIAGGVLACANDDHIVVNASGGGNVTDITSSLSGIPTVTIRNVDASAVTFVHNTSKLRCIGAVDKVVNQHESIQFALVSGTIWQQVGGKV